MSEYIRGLKDALQIIQQEIQVAKGYNQPVMAMGMLQVKELLEQKIILEEARG